MENPRSPAKGRLPYQHLSNGIVMAKCQLWKRHVLFSCKFYKCNKMHCSSRISSTFFFLFMHCLCLLYIYISCLLFAACSLHKWAIKQQAKCECLSYCSMLLSHIWCALMCQNFAKLSSTLSVAPFCHQWVRYTGGFYADWAPGAK